MPTPWSKRASGGALGALLLLLPAAGLRADGAPRPVGFRESARVHTGHAPVALALGDLDRDGRADAILVSDDSTLTTLLGDGAGGLGAQRDTSMGMDVVALALGDLDHDGQLDAVVSSPASGTVLSLLGAGDGGFDGVRTLRGPWSPGALALTRMSERPDLVVADLFFQSLVVARNVGGGSFEFANQVAGFLDPVSIAVGDLTRDALKDVAVADAASHLATVVTDPEESHFTMRRDQPIAGRPSAVGFGDLDRDGRDDVVIATRSPGALAVCRAAADGSLEPAHYVTAGSAPVALVLGDFDGDGRLDVAVADRDDVSIGVWLGRGDGTLIRLGGIPTGAGPAALAIADMNSDGWPDLVCANHDDGTVQVLLNTSTLAAGTVHLLAPTPNPASTSSLITFVLSTSMTVTLDVHDLAGRLVRRLIDGVMMPPGPNTVRWDGRTDARKGVCSGVYLVRLRAGNADVSTRLVFGR